MVGVEETLLVGNDTLLLRCIRMLEKPTWWFVALLVVTELLRGLGDGDGSLCGLEVWRLDLEGRTALFGTALTKGIDYYCCSYNEASCRSVIYHGITTIGMRVLDNSDLGH